MSVTRLVHSYYSFFNQHLRDTSLISSASSAPLVMSRSFQVGPGLAVPLSIAGLRAHGPLLLIPLVAAACVVLAISFTSSENQDYVKDIKTKNVEKDCVKAPLTASLPASLWRSFTNKSREQPGGRNANYDYSERSDEEEANDGVDSDLLTGPPLRIPPCHLSSVASEDWSLGLSSLKTQPATDPQFDDINKAPAARPLSSPDARSALRPSATTFVPTRKPLRPNASPFTPGRLGIRATTPVIDRIRDSRLRADAPKFSPKRKSRRGDTPKYTSGPKALRAGAPAFTPGRIGFRSTELVLPPLKTLRSDASPFTPGPPCQIHQGQVSMLKLGDDISMGRSSKLHF